MYIKHQLAEAFKNFTGKHNIYKGNYILEPKYDGLRAELASDGAYSRYGNKWGFAPNYLKPIQDFLTRAGVAVDGEWDCIATDKTGKLLPHYERRKMALSIMSKDRIIEQELRLIVFRAFDIIPANGNLTGWNRKELLKKIVPILQKISPIKIEESPYWKITSKEQFDALYNSLINDGWEGAMIKNMNAMYKHTRSFDWLKLKHRWTSDLPILGIGLGTKGKKNENRAGVVIVKTPLGTAKIGTGFPEQGMHSRDWFMQNQTTIKGLIVEIEHEGYANNEGNLLNASFKCVRTDKPRWEMSF